MNKKLMKALVLTLALTATLFILVACGGSKQSPYVGTWNAVKFEAYGVTMTPEEAGLTFSVDFTADGKVTATTNGEDDGAGTWEETDDGVKITDNTDQEITAKIVDDQLVLEMQGITFYLEKE